MSCTDDQRSPSAPFLGTHQLHPPNWLRENQESKRVRLTESVDRSWARYFHTLYRTGTPGETETPCVPNPWKGTSRRQSSTHWATALSAGRVPARLRCLSKRGLNLLPLRGSCILARNEYCIFCVCSSTLQFAMTRVHHQQM